MGRKSDPPFGRRQAGGFAHRPRQKGIDRRGRGPDPFLQPGQDQPVGADHPGLDRTQDPQAWVVSRAGADGHPRQQTLDQFGELFGQDLGQAVALVDQRRQQFDRRLAGGAGPERAELTGVRPLGQRLQRLGEAARRLARRRGVAGIVGQGQVQRSHQRPEQPPRVLQFGEAIRRDGLAVAVRGGGLQPRGDIGPIARTRPAQSVALQCSPPRVQHGRLQAQPRQRVFEDRQQTDGVRGIGRNPRDQRRQLPDRKSRQGRARRGIGQDPPARELRRNPPRQDRVWSDQSSGAAGGFQHLTQQQSGCGRRLMLGARGHHRESRQALGEGIDAGLGGLLAQRLDLAQPVGGRLGWTQRLVDDPPPPAAARIAGPGGRPGADLAALDVVQFQQALHRALRMLFAHLGPGRIGQILIQARQDHAAPGRIGDHAEQARGRRRRAGRAGGDQHLGGRSLAPPRGQGVQQRDASGGDVDQAQLGQAPGPDLDRQFEEVSGNPPVARHLHVHPALDRAKGADLFDLETVQKAGQGVGQLERTRSVKRALESVLVFDDQPRQLKAAAPGRNRRRQVQGQLPRLEGRLTFVQVAQGADAGQQQRPPAADLDEGLHQAPRRPPGGRQHDGVRQSLGTEWRQLGMQARRQVLDERPVRRDGEPARAGLAEDGVTIHASTALPPRRGRRDRRRASKSHRTLSHAAGRERGVCARSARSKMPYPEHHRTGWA